MTDLTQMRKGEKGRVVKIEGGLGLLRKLEALGIRRELMVTKASAQIMRGPITLKAGNTEVAIGYGMAKRVFVEVE
jgi:ferrous iron transport protein A